MQQKKWIRFLAMFMAVLMLGGVLIQFISMLFALAADDDLSALQQKIDALNQERNQLTSQRKSVQKEKDSELMQKAELEKSINGLSSDISTIDGKISELDVDIEEKELEIQVLQMQVDAQTVMYLQQIREVHEYGPTGMLDVLFGAASLTEFLTQRDRAAEMAQYQESVINALKENKESVLEIKASIELDRAMQENLRLEVQKKRLEVESKQNEVNKTINALDGDLSRYKKLIEENEKEEEKLQDELKKRLAAMKKTDFVGGEFIWPTPGYTRITDDYGMRTHPITGKKKMHTGMDIAAAGGTQILASNSGTVVIAEYNSSWGNYCVIDHGDGIATLYAHMQKSALVKVGEVVVKGQKIGIVGTTGLSTGNHLHFEFRENGEHTSPYKYVTKP